MLNKRRIISAALVLIIAATAPLPAAAAERDGDAQRSEAAAPAPENRLELSLGADDYEHEAYITGYEDGTFRPEATVTRAEAAQMLFAMIPEPPEERAHFKDVGEDDWFYDGVGLMGALGAFGTEDGFAYPNRELTRAEFVRMLALFFPPVEDAECPYSDVPPDSRDYASVAKAVSLGWLTGYEDGTFRPDKSISRAETAAVINRALGRSCDREKINNELIIPLFSDVFADHWAYYEVCEAALEHTRADALEPEEEWTWFDYEKLLREPGLYFSGVELYCVGEDGLPVRDAEAGGLYFGHDGRYTSGDEEIDAYVKDALRSCTTPYMTREEKLRAAYLYARDSFTYLRRHYYKIGDQGWQLEEARTMFETGRGNCYCYTSVLYFLTRQLGYDATAISGVVGHARDPHGWVEIDFDGVTYIFDSELEMAYRKKGIYTYDFFMMSYDRVPWPYEK